MSNMDAFTDVMALTSGAAFVRGDLHIHSVLGSHDVTDATATPEMIVQTALASSLSVIAIADHNSIDGVEAAINAAALDDLLVVPAIELSTMQGHLLCYLPDMVKLRAFYAQLTVRDFGLPTSRVENNMVDCLGKAHALGGFGILAHVDGPKGLETEMPGGSQHKADIICHPGLLAIELKNASSLIAYAEADPDSIRIGMGRDRVTRSEGVLRPLARVLSSDAHNINALGRNATGDQRVTRYKMQALTFDALKHALTESDSRVRLEDEVPRSVPTVQAVTFKGGFLKDQSIHFSPNLTCIIGGRGTGKSTTFEAIRAFSAFPSGNTVVNSDVWPDRIDLAFVDEAAASHHLSWSRGDTSPTNINDPFDGPETIPVECYGQGETQKISQRAQDDPAALLGYLDRFTDVRSELELEESLRVRIFEIEAKVSEAGDKVGLIPQYQRELNIARQQIKKFTDGNAKQIIQCYQQIEAERQSRKQIVEQARNISVSLDYATVKDALTSLKDAADPTTLVVGKDEFEAIREVATEFETGISASESDLRQKSNHLSDFVRQKIVLWNEKEKTLLVSIETQKAALEAQGITVDTAYISKLTKDEASYVATVANLQTWAPRLQALIATRDDLVSQRWAARTAVSAKRKSFAAAATKKLRNALSDLNVTLKFEQSGHSPQAYDLLVEVMAWRTTQVPRASTIVRSLTVPGLIKCIIDKDTAPIQALTTSDGVAWFNRGEAQNIIDRFGDAAVFSRLQTVQVFDRPKLTVTRVTDDASGQKKYLVREFGQLSLGQQQSVLLALMLSSENPNPLLIDQPEDNLDSEFIYSQLVPVIRLAKERRQIIIVTHNPNIAILGDAEQIVVLKATNEKAMIVSRGSVDHHETKESACAILEGAKAAFTRRGKIYGCLQ